MWRPGPRRPAGALNQRDAVQVIGSPRERPTTSSCGCGAPPREGRPGPLVKSTIAYRYSRPFDEEPQHRRQFSQIPAGRQCPRLDAGPKGGSATHRLTRAKNRVFSGATARNGPWLTRSRQLKPAGATPIPPKSSCPADRRGCANWCATTPSTVQRPVLHKDDNTTSAPGASPTPASEHEVIGLTTRVRPDAYLAPGRGSPLQEAVDRALPPDRINLIVAAVGRRPASHVPQHLRPPPGHALPRGTEGPKAPKRSATSPRGCREAALVKCGPHVCGADGLKLDAYVTLPLNYAAGQAVQ